MVPAQARLVRVAAVVLLLIAAACSDHAGEVVVYAPAAPSTGTALAVQDLVTDLGMISGRTVTRKVGRAAGCEEGALRVVVLGEDADASPALEPQAYTIEEQRCGDDGHLVILRGGSMLASQWAIYELLEGLGVRYFHPERTYYPAAARWPASPFDVAARPAFVRRSLHAHRTHPIELSAPLAGSPAEAERYQRHWIDWNVKIRSTSVDGWDASVLGTYPYERGFPRLAGINLLNAQQGGRPVIDVDDPRPETVQIAEAIDVQMAPLEGAPPVSEFNFQFNPNEFTVVDEQQTVDRLTFITTYIGERWPGVEVFAINHGTAQGPGPTFGIRFFDLPQLAPPALSVQVHPLMFYDLERPAPVYGNADFTFQRDWIIREQARRRIQYYPEGSWWLTFDLPVPLYLAPVTLEARDHDLKLLAPYISGDERATTGVIGHRLFSSGHEWGYWMIDYCTARMTWDLELGWVGCLDHVTSAFAHGAQIRDVLEAVGRAQVAPLRDPAILAMLVGSDDETEAAAGAGIHFHPLPPAPADVLRWSDEAAAQLATGSVAPLAPMADQYRQWAEVLASLVADQSPEQAPWVREIADGLRITGLRAAHARAVYATTLQLRAAIRDRDFDAVAAAQAGLAEARAVTAEAAAIVEAREADYRYPAHLTIAGDEPGTADALPNQTIYPYRYLSRTHRLFYWHRPDAQLAATFGGDRITVTDRILTLGRALDVAVLVDGITELTLVWGDGDVTTVLDPQIAPHTYAAEGVYDWTLDVVHALGALRHTDRCAIVARRLAFVKGALDITAPAGAGLIEGLLPGLVIGLGTDAGGEFLVLGQALADPPVVERGTVVRRGRTGLTSGPADLQLELRNVGPITVFGAVITVSDGSGPTARTLQITGELSTDEVIALIVATGGFDETGAREVVAGQLGYTPETLPARVPLDVRAMGTE